MIRARPHSRPHRHFLAALIAVVMLYAHLAAAAYSCPGLELPSAASAIQALPDCDSHPLGGMDPEQPQLCKAHCDPDRQSSNSGAGGLLTPGAAPMPVLLWVLPPAPSPVGTALPAHAPAHGPPRGGPPLYLSLLVLRN